jgi:hypothetical protein
MNYTDVEWDENGRLIIKNKDLIRELRKFVSAPSSANGHNENSRANPPVTNLFQVVTDNIPGETEPMDLLCKIIVVPRPPKP